MSKVKAKCANCHRAFKASSRQTLCQDCERKAHAASKLASAKPAASAAPVAPPKISGPGAAILDPRLAATASTVASGEPSHGEGATSSTRDGTIHHGPAHEQPAPHPNGGGQEKPGRQGKGPRGETSATAGKEPRPKREPKPLIPPFEVTDELRERIEARYLELAQPVEFDGIRTQMARELDIPKAAVKKVVQDLRERRQLPSWWDLQAYAGTPEDLERIRVAYTPLLPLPEVGAHKRIAAGLGLEERMVYQGIRRIRAEMQLPQYNPPEAHALESGRAPAAVADSAQAAVSATSTSAS